MKQKIIEFIRNKEKEKLADTLIFASYAGSHLHNTQDADSDFDMRAVAVLDENYIIGLETFDMEKLNSGENGITTSGDMDIEIYHYDSFIKRVISGEANVVDMLYAPDDKIVFMNDLFKPIRTNRHLFYSKNLLRHYKGLIYKHYRQAKSDPKKLKKNDRIARIEKYGYETKDVMKAIMYLDVSIEFLETGELNLFRHDRERLLEIKNGGLGNFEEADRYIQKLMKKRDEAHEHSHLPPYPDMKMLNDFMKEYQKMILSHIGVI